MQLSTAAPSAYDTWASGFGLSGPNADTMADTGNSGAGDGLEQIFEFAFGTNPTVSDNSQLAVTGGTTFTPGTPIIDVSFSPPSISCQFVRRVDHATAGVTYTPQATADGLTFEDSTDLPTVVVPDDGSGYEVVEVPFPLFLPNGMKSEVSLARIEVTLAD